MSQVYARLTDASLEKEYGGTKLELIINSAVVPCSEIVDSEKPKLPIVECCDPIKELRAVEGCYTVVENISGRSLSSSEESVQTCEKISSNFAIQMKKQIAISPLTNQIVVNVHQGQKASKRYARDLPSKMLLDFKDEIVSKSSRKKLVTDQINMLDLQNDTNLILETVTETTEEHNITSKKPTVDLEKFCHSTPLHNGCKFSDKNNGSKAINKIQHLIKICPKLTSVKDSEGRTPLHYACATDAGVSVVDMLLKENDKMCMVADNIGRLPLHLASLSQSINTDIIFSLCVFHPDAAKVEDVFGMTPFQYMNYGKFMEMFVVT